MSQKSTETPFVIAAAAVHLFTALGAVAAFFATLAAIDRNVDSLFFWLAVALFIDGVDGTFARAVKVHDRLPRFSGETLDLVVDYVTYVFVPVLALVLWDKLAGPLGQALAVGALLSSLYHFADTESKDGAYRFIGFPALWNVVAFYVFVFELSSDVTALATVICIVTAFLPLPFAHPLRVTFLRRLTLAVLAAGSFAGAALLFQGFPAARWMQWVLGLAAAYGLGLTVYWTVIERLKSERS